MCRYAFHSYKSRYVCFGCRKAFKRQPAEFWARAEQPGPQRTESPFCPQCGQRMAEPGMDFHPPKQRDRKQWQKVEMLCRAGFRFGSCGCGDGYRPRSLNEVPEFLEWHRQWPKSPGAALLKTIAARHGT